MNMDIMFSWKMLELLRPASVVGDFCLQTSLVCAHAPLLILTKHAATIQLSFVSLRRQLLFKSVTLKIITKYKLKYM